MKIIKMYIYSLALLSFAQLNAGAKIPLVLNTKQAKESELLGVFSRMKRFYSANPNYVSSEMLKDCRDLTVRYSPGDEERSTSVNIKQQRRSSSEGFAFVELEIERTRSYSHTKNEYRPLYYYFRDEASKTDYLMHITNKYTENFWTKEMVPVETTYQLIKVSAEGEIQAIRYGIDMDYSRTNRKGGLSVLTKPFVVAAALNPFGVFFVLKEIAQSAKMKCGDLETPKSFLQE